MSRGTYHSGKFFFRACPNPACKSVFEGFNEGAEKALTKYYAHINTKHPGTVISLL